MNQIDFIGGIESAPARPFKDIRNTRSTIAEEKAVLCLELGRLCSAPPKAVLNGSVQLTRAWIACQQKSKALAANSRASAVELGIAIKAMRKFLGPE